MQLRYKVMRVLPGCLVLTVVLLASAHAQLFRNLAPPLVRAEGVGEMTVTYDPEEVKLLQEGTKIKVEVLTTMDLTLVDVYATSTDLDTADVQEGAIVFERLNSTHYNSSILVYSRFLGYSRIYLSSYAKVPGQPNDTPGDRKVLRQSNALRVSCTRVRRIWDSIFNICLAIMIPLIYINFGCALNWEVVLATVKRPIGPALGFISQFGFMPLISFFLSRLMFPGETAMQLGMFFTGCSPGGGASNIWTLTLGGNLDLSITMTTISTFASFAMVPLWVFTLGRVIFEEGNLGVPYGNITTVAISLIVPLIIGTLVQRFLPRVSKFLIVTMKPFAIFLLVFIIVFGTITNIYLFILLDWKIVIGGLGVPWLGYMFGAILSRVLMQPGRDIIAISVETGVQNSGIAVFLLRFALPQPEADLAMVVPMAVSLMTPIPLAMLAFVLKAIKWRKARAEKRAGGASSESLPSSTEQGSTTASDQPVIVVTEEKSSKF